MNKATSSYTLNCRKKRSFITYLAFIISVKFCATHYNCRFLNKITNNFPNMLLTYEKHVQGTCSLLRLYSSATTFLDLQSLSADGHWMILTGCQNVKWLECLCNRDTTLLTDKSFFHVHWFINKYIKPKNIIYNFLRNKISKYNAAGRHF